MTVRTNKIYYTPKTTAEGEIIEKELTYQIPTYTPLKGKHTIALKNFSKIGKVMLIPHGRTDLIQGEWTDKSVTVPAEFPEPKLTMRSEQQEVYDLVEDSCLIQAQPAFGKTYLGVFLAGKFKQKTLIITHTVEIRHNWEDAIKTVYGIEPGVIGSGKFNTDAPIVVSNVQTLIRHYTKYVKTFGLIILDEAHHAPASTFKKVISSMEAKYRIGLSATLKERKDGLGQIIPDFFSSTTYYGKKSNDIDPKVFLWETETVFPHVPGNWAQSINNLLYDEEYIDEIAGIVSILKDRKILVVAPRLEFLSKLYNRLDHLAAVLITGSDDKEERRLIISELKYETEPYVICASTSIFSEGVSVDSIDTLILPYPINNELNLIQLCGRATRLVEGKKQPIIVDVRLQGRALYEGNKLRDEFYKKKGWQYM